MTRWSLLKDVITGLVLQEIFISGLYTMEFVKYTYTSTSALQRQF